MRKELLRFAVPALGISLAGPILSSGCPREKWDPDQVLVTSVLLFKEAIYGYIYIYIYSKNVISQIQYVSSMYILIFIINVGVSPKWMIYNGIFGKNPLKWMIGGVSKNSWKHPYTAYKHPTTIITFSDDGRRSKAISTMPLWAAFVVQRA